MSVLGTPLANFSMGFGKTGVGTIMDGRCDTTGWQLRALHPIVADKRFRHLCTDFDCPLAIQVQGHVTSWLLKTGGADE